MSERRAPLRKRLPGLALVLGSAFPALFKHLVGVEGKTFIEKADALNPRLFTVDEVSVGNSWKRLGVTYGKWATESIAGPFPRR